MSGVLPDGLVVSMSVQPGEVDQRGAFTARLTATNTTSATINIATAHGCLAVPSVLRNGEEVPFRGSWWACTAAGANHAFAPGETRVIEWTMHAELYAQHPGDQDGAPAPRGVYTVRGTFDAPPVGGRGKPHVEAALRVR